MKARFFTEGIKISSRRLVAITFLTSGTIAWFFLLSLFFYDAFGNFSVDQSWIYLGEVLFLGVGAVSALVGAALSKKLNRRKLILSWIVLGIFATGSLLVFQGVFSVLVLSVLLGLSLGLGFPSCTALFADCTTVEERARVSGIIILETFVMVSLAAVVVTLLGLDAVAIVAACLILRASSLLGIILDPCGSGELGIEHSWFSIFSDRKVIFYTFPWIMFNVASGLAMSMLLVFSQTPGFESAFVIGTPLRYVGTALFGLFAGIVADRIGRKPPIIVALVILGVSFAFLGLSSSSLSVLVYLVVSGIAWGLLMVVYLAVLGDLSSAGSKEKYYAVGVIIPFIIYMTIAEVSHSFVVSPSVLSPVLSIMIFLSIIPVLYASETLPESRIRERELKEHLKKVGDLVSDSGKK